MAEQLKMFMTPREVLSQYTPNEDERVRAVEDIGTTYTSRDKIMHAQRNGLYQEVEKHGVKKPIAIVHEDPARGRGSVVINGHHRLFSQGVINPDQLMPVEHHGDNFKYQHVDWTDADEDPKGDLPRATY